MDQGFFKRNSKKISITPVTFRKYWRILLKEKWITINCKRDACHIIGFSRLCKKLRIKTRKAAIFRTIDFKRFKEFLIGSVITYAMIKKRNNDRASVFYIPRSTSTKALSSISSYFLPNLYLAKVLKISKSTASEYKHLAEKAGYIKTKKHWYNLPIESNEIKNYREYSDDNRGYPKLINGKACVQTSDIIKSNIVLKRKRNLRTLRKREKYPNRIYIPRKKGEYPF